MRGRYRHIMAKRFTIEVLMNLAKNIGANPTKLAGTRTNISFLGKGPAKNPLFQNRLAGLENASEQNLGKPETLFAAIEDAVGWAKDGKLNGIQMEILGHNLSGINKILNPPPLPMASVTPIRSGIEGLKKEFVGLDELGFTKERARALGRFPKESHKFMGRPLKDKDFAEIDQMIMEGKLPDLKGRRWNLKTPERGQYDDITKKMWGSRLPEPGPGDKNRPFLGWTPKVVPKATNIPASKINHQMIADKYGIDVELIRGKDWIEVLEVIKNLGLRHGGLARILEV